jgi:hypothetical protein
LTESEVAALQWIFERTAAESWSAAVRMAIRALAKKLGMPEAIDERIRAERSAVVPRRSVRLARVIGRRRSGDPRQESA